ncbi:MAG: nitroreductase family protein [Candidatus Anstonellales archaeon]
MEKIFANRRSIRSFKPKPVEESKIKEIMDAITSAPSAGNLQGYRVFYTRKSERIKSIADACWQEWIEEAPVVFVFFADPKTSGAKYGKRGESLYCIQDATIACAYAQLQASALGLGACWVGAFDDEKIKEIFKAHSLIPVAVLPVGYPNESPFPRQKKNRITEI